MMEMYSYGLSAHHVAKLLSRECYPLSRSELAEKYGESAIEVGWGKTMLFSALLERMGLENYETAVAFYAALNARL